MVPMPITPRGNYRGRPRGRPPGSGSSSRIRKVTSGAPASEPPPKKRRYKPGGPGGGGRFIDENGIETPAETTGLPVIAPRARASASALSNAAPSIYPRREPSTRIRTAVNRDELDDMHYSSAAAVAAAVVQSEGYKPREERGWEEFHPNLDIEATFMVFHASDVDGTAKPIPPALESHVSKTSLNGVSTPTKDADASSMAVANVTSGQGKPAFVGLSTDSPSRRRVGRPPRDSTSIYAGRASELGIAPRIPKVLPIQNQTSKERLELKNPSYRKTDRILLFESKTFGQARYVEKSMMNAGYQESDNYIRPEHKLLKAIDSNADEELDQSTASKGDADFSQPTGGAVGRVEYDMDEQDDMWLEKLNTQRRATDLDPITREIFEITITKIEKEWHALEKRIPKPNPKPPQTHRPRSSSAVAVNGEPHAGEEQDSKCAICDDGDCENTNAIVFCDGCDLAVHQECYGVPFIPEGQWLCRKCQLIGRGIPTCIFCPNTDGAFKQTNSSKWAHLLCAMWIPEVSLGNHTFMEPVMEVEKVPRTRWKLQCYICNQRMGACIQCSNKNCYQAFHVTCARRGRLFLKMKNSQGALTVLDGSVPLKAFCDKHCPQDYAKEHNVSAATKEARRFYRRTMKGRIWADSAASALQLAATHRHAVTEHPPDESQMTGAKVSAVLLGDKKKGQPGKPMWKLPSGAPIIPQAVYDIVESSLARFPIRKRKDYVAEACRYWTLKREARRGAALLKRLQLQMETFTSMELTRRNFAAMGPSGKARLVRRIEFAKILIRDLEQLKMLSEDVVEREASKLEEAELEQDFVDTCYFPVYKLLLPVVEKAFTLDKNVFKEGLSKLQDKLDARYYTTTLAFAHDLCEVIHVGINAEYRSPPVEEQKFDSGDASSSKQNVYSEARDRKRLGKRILKYVQPQLEMALQAEADISSKPLDTLRKEFDGMLEASLEVRQPTITVSQDDGIAAESQDVVMGDAAEEGQIIVAGQHGGEAEADEEAEADVEMEADAEADAETDTEAGADVGSNRPNTNGETNVTDQMEIDDSGPPKPGGGGGNIEVNTSKPEETAKSSSAVSSNASMIGTGDEAIKTKTEVPDGLNDSGSPPSFNGYAPVVAQPPHSGPLTPPQSNGSLGWGQTDMLSDGGLPWYLKGFELQGTTVVEEQWTGREAMRNLSEELTDMDDDALKDLEFDVDDETITASLVNASADASAIASASAVGATAVVVEDNEPPAAATVAPSTRRRASGNNRPARSRKGVRSSTRRR